MRSAIAVPVLIGSVMLLAACGAGSNKPASSSAPPAATVVATFQAAAATPASNPAERVSGTVQAVDGNKVTLKEGGSFTLGPQTAITHRVPATTADLQAGKAVAVTAKQQPDNTLLASAITVFPQAPSSSFFRQFPMDDGNLMTNATIDKVSGSTFSASFPGGSAQVTLAPNVQVTTIASGTAADIKIGSMVNASVVNGVAQSVSIS